MNKLVLVTTKGCEGCKIMSDNIAKAIDVSKKDIYVQQVNINDLTRRYIRTFGISDCPTTLIFRDGQLKRKEVGSRPYIVIARWLDIDFK